MGGGVSVAQTQITLINQHLIPYLTIHVISTDNKHMTHRGDFATLSHGETKMAKLTAQQWLQKWGTNLTSSTTYIKAGVNGVQTAPGQSAAAAADRMLAGITEAVQSGAWGKAVAAVPLQAWKDSMINKGIPRLSQGVTQAQATKVQAVTNLLTAIDTSVASIAGLPKGGLENNIARSTAFMRAMSANAPKRQG